MRYEQDEGRRGALSPAQVSDLEIQSTTNLHAPDAEDEKVSEGSSRRDVQNITEAGGDRESRTRAAE